MSNTLVKENSAPRCPLDDRATLLANVLNDPKDDTARLVLADWLEEHGEEPFGRFLRAGVVAARFRGTDLIDDPEYYAALEILTDVTTSAHTTVWLSALGLGPSPLAFGDWSWDNAGDRVTVRIGTSVGVFARGMLTELEVTLDEWHALAALVFAAWPLACVRASEVPGLSFEVERMAPGWRLTGRLRLPRRNVPLTGHAIPSAIAPGAVLTQSSTDWAADQFFEDRAALVRGAAHECAMIVVDLKEAAGDRWPRPPARRRR